VTVFFGVNASGKTTLLDALAIGLGAIVSRVPRATGLSFAHHGDIRVPWKDRAEGRRDERRRATLRARDDHPARTISPGTSPKHRWVGDRAKAPPPERRRQTAARGCSTRLVKEALEGGVPNAASQPPIPLVAVYGTERAVVEVPAAQAQVQQGISSARRAGRVAPHRTRFKTVFEWFVVAEDEERRERERRKDFSYLHPTLQWVRGAVERAGLRCKNPRIESQPIRMLVDFEHADGSLEPLDISSLSDGYRTHFSLVVDIARRMVQLNPSDDLTAPDRGTNSEGVILIDDDRSAPGSDMASDRGPGPPQPHSLGRSSC